jgi:beta-galactosidase
MLRQLFIIGALAATTVAGAQPRQEITLTDDWQFSRDKQQWQTVSVPHDWAIGGPFDKKWDLQSVAIVQNGETTPTEKSGRSGALPWIGEGHYRRTVTIPAGTEHAELLFDGAMAEPTVWLNGHKAGYWAYGYNTFRVDLTPYMKAGDNLLEVDLKNVEESSRWYPGAGIYRPVTLIMSRQERLDDWSIFVRTTDITNGKATIHAEGKALASTSLKARMTLIAPDGREVATSGDMALNADGSFFHVFTLDQAQLWSPENPVLYRVRTQLVKDGSTVDEKTLKTGIRMVRVSREHGFQLNGVTRKIKGVCLHHDLGPLGAAVNKAALIRQIKTLKEMGCDAIRTSHNMPSQMQMDLCDSLGMMVMAESFDMWVHPKCKNGYARFFQEWWQRDITNLVVANRNHPAIIMWSIGNEIWEQWMPHGRQWAIRLQGLCHALDPSRPVTQGMDQPDGALDNGFAQAMEVPGFNYRVHKYADNLKRLPQGFLLGSETASTVSSRGVYHFPVEPNDNSKNASWHKDYDPKAIQQRDGQCSSYDLEYCPWSNLPDDDWAQQEDIKQVIGEFVWTGYDYLGEPSPYDEYWPSRSSYFGICDLAGLPKDRYWLYRSHWNKQQHTIHLLPHWTWGKERRGQVTPVYCYTDYPTAELFVNGKSQGKRTKDVTSRLDRYRLRWNEVRYEPGELRVVVYDKDGRQAGEQTLRTAGKPARLQLDAWTQQSEGSPLTAQSSPLLKADGDDLAFVTVSLVDKQGTLIPDAADQLTFEVTGAGRFQAACNGDATSLEPFTQPTMKLFNGQLVVILRSAKRTGNITLRVTDRQRGLSQHITLQVQ